jgi:hypothetical protein
MGLPALVAVAHEVRGWRHYLRGELGEACRELGAARQLYARHHLARAWGYAAQFGHADALLWEVDAGRLPAREALGELVQIARTVTRELGALPMFRGLGDVLWGIVAARRGQVRRAEQRFARAEASRGHAISLWDAWTAGRIAVERHRLGVSAERVAAGLDTLRRDAASFGAGIAIAAARFEAAIARRPALTS